MFINEVTLYGNLTREVELKALPSGAKVAQISLATNREWKDKQTNEKKEEVAFHSVVAYGKQAEVIAQYVKKGQSIFIKGRLITRSWDGENGKKVYKTEIVLENFQFGVNKKEGGSSYQQQEQGGYSKDYSKPQSEQEGYDVVEYPDDSINPEDIPF